jgi:colanic acid/amylovoran biosynthesis glycosyltransferase
MQASVAAAEIPLEPAYSSERISVVQNSHMWLERTQAWLYLQLAGLPPEIEVHVAAERIVNADEFPIADVDVLRKHGIIPYVFEKTLARLGIRRHGHVLSVIKRSGAQVLHSHFGPVAWAALTAAERAGVPHLATFYGYDVTRLPMEDPIWRSRYRDLFKSVRSVLCEGPHMAERIKDLGCDAEKIVLHRLGVPVEELAYRPRSLTDGPLRVLIAASFREKKGIPYALEALGRFAKRNPVVVTVAGREDGSEASRVEAERIRHAAGSAGIPINFLGSVSHARLKDELYRNDVLMAPSVSASDGDTEGGAPVTIIEAAATGMPIVSTRHCDIPDVLDQSSHLLADERDVGGLVDRLDWLIDNEWSDFLARTRADIEARYNASRQGKRLAELYVRVARWN